MKHRKVPDTFYGSFPRHNRNQFLGVEALKESRQPFVMKQVD